MVKLAHDLQADVLSRITTYALVIRGYYFVGGQLGEEKRPEPHAEVDVAIQDKRRPPYPSTLLHFNPGIC
jgi:hypothetical protein